MEKNLDALLKSVSKAKISDFMKKAERGELSDILDTVDTEKAQKMIDDFGLSEKTKNADLGKLLNEVKQNPAILEKLKKLF